MWLVLERQNTAKILNLNIREENNKTSDDEKHKYSIKFCHQRFDLLFYLETYIKLKFKPNWIHENAHRYRKYFQYDDDTTRCSNIKFTAYAHDHKHTFQLFPNFNEYIQAREQYWRDCLSLLWFHIQVSYNK